MKLINTDFKRGTVKLSIEDQDDLWYLSHIIAPNDGVRGKTTRKMKLGDKESAKQVKKTITLTISVEKVTLESADTLRILGKVISGPEEIPLGSHHTISLTVGSDAQINKTSWLSYQRQKLKEASAQKYLYLLCIFDREEALFAMTKKSGFNVLSQLKGHVEKKRVKEKVKVKESFYSEIIKTLDDYNGRYKPQAIIIASPVFYKEDLMKQINNDWKKNVTLANCSSVDEQSLNEVIKRPEVKNVLQKSRLRKESILVDELLKEINRNGLVSYGMKEVTLAVTAAAVRILLVADSLLEKTREEETYNELDQLMKNVDQNDGEVHIISSDHQSGKQLKHLGGIAALLRFKVN